VAVSNRHEQKTRDRILAAAQALFVEKGFDGTSLGDIAKRAIVNQSLIHHHFGNKKNLWCVVKTHLLENYLRMTEEKLTEASDNFTEGLRDVMVSRFEFLTKNSDVVRMLDWQRLNHIEDSVNSQTKALARLFVEWVENAKQQGVVREEINSLLLLIIVLVMSSGWFQGDFDWIFAEMGVQDKAAISEYRAQYLEQVIAILEKGIYP
jgi:AcrR family transcriptional regulator